MLQESKKLAFDLIASNMPLFKELIRNMIKNRKLTSMDFVNIFKSHGILLNNLKAEEFVPIGYKDLTEKFLLS